MIDIETETISVGITAINITTPTTLKPIITPIKYTIYEYQIQTTFLISVIRNNE